MQVILKGIQPNIPVSEARIKLAALFKATPEQIDKLLANPGYVVTYSLLYSFTIINP